MTKKLVLAALVCVATLLPLVPQASAQKALQPLLCPPGGCTVPPGGGGGGGGGGTNYNLAWTFNVNYPMNPGVGGVGDREGFGAAIFNGQLWVAHTGPGTGDQPVYIGSVDDSSSIPGSYQYVNPSGGQAYGDSNPALVAYGSGGTGHMFLIINDASHNTGVWRLDGTVWNFVSVLPVSSDYSAGAAISDDNSTLYIGLRAWNNSTDETLTICRVDIASSATSCSAHPGTQKMLFNPELAFWNGTLYAAFAADNGSHSVEYYTSTDGGQTINLQTSTSGDQASVSPKLVKFNNALYMGFRSNDSSQHFLTRYTTDGINWTGSVDTGISIHGAPMMVNSGDNTGSIVPRALHITNLFTDSNLNLVEYFGNS